MGKGGPKLSNLGSFGRSAASLDPTGMANIFMGGIGADDANKRLSNALGGAAMAQQRMATQQYRYNRGQLDSARKDLSGYTVKALADLDRDIANQDRNLKRQEQLISQLDPTIIEAAQQALKLLKGEESSTLSPLKRQRQMQRDKLLSSLREQLGPGAETSTMGIQALNRFDSETDNLFSGAQQQALSNLGGLSSQFTSQRPDMFREIMGLSGLGQQKYGLGLNMANFDLQRINALQGGQAAMLGTAGAQYAGDIARNQYLQGAGQRQQEYGIQTQESNKNALLSLLGGSAGGSGGTVKPTTGGTQTQMRSGGYISNGSY